MKIEKLASKNLSGKLLPVGRQGALITLCLYYLPKKTVYITVHVYSFVASLFLCILIYKLVINFVHHSNLECSVEESCN